MKHCLIISLHLIMSGFFAIGLAQSPEDPEPSDSLLYVAPELYNRVNEILAIYHIGPDRDSLLPDEAYFEAVDIIMNDLSSEPEISSVLADYLASVFEENDMASVEEYIAWNYLGAPCETDIVEIVLERMEGYKKMQAGTLAPGFSIKDRFNNSYSLDQMESKLVLVMFWASTCDHCQRLIPRLHDWYTKENNINMEFISISIDTSRHQYEDFVSRHQLEWICAYEPLGWHGKVPTAYNVYATPSLFLLDEERRIISKPLTYRAFIRDLRKF